MPGCCNEYGICTQGKDCPVRATCDPMQPMPLRRMPKPVPTVTWRTYVIPYLATAVVLGFACGALFYLAGRYGWLNF